MLRTLPGGSVDAIVTDPPYGLNFLGNTWDNPRMVGQLATGKERRGPFAYGGSHDRGYADHDGVRFQAWCLDWARECLRVLKPGGHLLAFGGSRTWHRLASAIEDAGFELRDSIAWLYGNGFPKSKDVSDAMNAFLADDPGPTSDAPSPDVYLVTAYLRAARDAAGWGNKRLDALFGTNGMAGHWTSQRSQPAVPSLAQWARLKEALAPHLGDEVDHLVERFAAAERPEPTGAGDRTFLGGLGRGEHGSAGGWGTALKPALEPVVVARKLPTGTVTANVRTHGTGALNIDGCRVSDVGRWPANVALDETAAAALGEPARYFPTFRYASKAPTSERPQVDGVTHPTVKPLDLMRWLVRLVTPPGGTVLDPFAGSGTTIEAAIVEGFHVVGVEREAAYLPLIAQRIARGTMSGTMPTPEETP